MRPSSERAELASRIDGLLETLDGQGANLSVRSGRDAVDQGVPLLVERDVLADAGSRVRVRDRTVLRYYARTIQHLLGAPRRSAH
jgi:hypothetical protein